MPSLLPRSPTVGGMVGHLEAIKADMAVIAHAQVNTGTVILRRQI